MKTVLHTIDTWGPGGAETVCVELAGGIDRSRFRSRAAALRRGWVYDAFRTRGIEPAIVPPGAGPVDVALFWRLMSLARSSGAALIQSHLLTTNLYCSLIGRLLRIPSVATFHGMVDIAPNDRRARQKMWLISKNVTRLVFVSQALRRHFHARHAAAEDRTVVIPNGIDAEHFRPRRSNALRAELGLPDDAVIVGAVGNIRPAKGYDVFLDVAAQLRTENPRLRFVVAGEPGEPLYTNLLEQRRRLGLENHVFFLGFRESIAEVLNGIDLYLSTSTSEGFSLTTIQAMASGLPVVATLSGGPEEIVTAGQDGLLVPVGDVHAIARAVTDLLANPEASRTLGAAARETVLRRFTLQRMISAYEAIYDEAMERPR